MKTWRRGAGAAGAFIVDAARVGQALLDLQAIEREIGRPPWRDLLKELRSDRAWFAAAIGDKSVRSGPTSLGTMQ